MAKTIFILLFGLSYTLSAQYTAIPDANFENYLEQNGMGDGVPDNGLVLTENIENVTILELSMKQISDLTGIQDFTSLERLDVSFNQLVTLDVSNNPELEVLTCQVNTLNSLILNNPKLTGLAAFENYLPAIDLSNSPLLEYVDLDINLNLTSLDVSNNPHITYLSFVINAISEIDLSQNSSLEMINCGVNYITLLDFSDNHNLVWVGGGNLPNLTYVDMRNGNNHNVVSFGTTGTNNLQCIFVDDASAPYLDNWHKDGFTHFVNNEQECDALSVTEQLAGETRVYPNPVKGPLFIRNAEQEITGIRVYDLLGRLVWEKGFREKSVELDLSSLRKGLYVLHIESEGSVLQKKIIKE